MNANNYLPEKILIPFFGQETSLIGIEIGVLTAVGSVAMLIRMPNLKLYSIDPWRHFDNNEFEAGWKQEELDKAYLEAVNRLKPFKARSILIKKTSDEAINDLSNIQADFIYIDGDHTYEQVKKDIGNYLPILKKNHSILAGHDWQNDGVKKAVLEFFKIEELQFGDDWIWYHVFQ